MLESFQNMSAILAAITDYFWKLIFCKIAATFLEISRKHVFTASDRIIVKNRVKKEKLKQILLKINVIQILICIIIFA